MTPSADQGTTWRVALLLALLLVATSAMSPLLGVPVHGRNFGHDSDYALTALSFMDAGWSAGRLWPRWVMETNFGLGGITFYTYPPVGYWAGALLRRVTGLDIPGTLALAVMLWRLVFLLGCFLWLRRHVAPGAALAAAALAALLPYPAVVNPWIRFAYAEVAGAAILPFLLLALERVAEGRDGRGMPALALAFAALAMTHLPTCALVAHLAPLYAWAYAGPRAAMRVLCGGIAGAGLAACFVLPAMGLLRDANFEGLEDGTWEGSLFLYGLPRGDSGWIQFLVIIWSAAALAGLATLAFRRLGGVATRGPLARAALLLLAVSAALMTVVTLPLWVVLPQLRSIEFPWRATTVLTLPLAAMAALALAGGRQAARRLVLGLGLACAVFAPAYLWARVAFGHPDWPRFLPPEERLARAVDSPRGVSSEHLPAWALANGWRMKWNGTETAPAPDPHPRPALPPGTQRLTAGYLVPEANGPLLLPQFWFPAWAAEDGKGEPVAVRPGKDGFLEVAVDRPVHDLRVHIAVTPWEWAGWAITGISAAGLLGFGLWRRRPGLAAAPALAAGGPGRVAG
ncbi:hypothetical protein E2C06_17555 [Dankookia rubra]|uniref:Membrane protein 6-pyruvoyl-tetrahydropterin synthase-related domain-containing protein n=1 Tax=Dankookia rubra TaxID=1442381 RepID=A0A4R5QF42_9PROT|nr:hypothetical protein [Dankookia rubra]TDH61309.1 hypothetical protein E2C06_17555 [Dankookia rubra]